MGLSDVGWWDHTSGMEPRTCSGASGQGVSKVRGSRAPAAACSGYHHHQRLAKGSGSGAPRPAGTVQACVHNAYRCCPLPGQEVGSAVLCPCLAALQAGLLERVKVIGIGIALLPHTANCLALPHLGERGQQWAAGWSARVCQLHATTQ